VRSSLRVCGGGEGIRGVSRHTGEGRNEKSWSQAMSRVYTGGRHLHDDSRTSAEVESIKALKCPDRVYKREFERFAGAHSVTNTHVMVVIVEQKMCAVPVRSGI